MDNKLIAISGKSGSGKDLIGQIICNLLQGKKHIKGVGWIYNKQCQDIIEIKKFADKLKERIALTWNIDRALLEDQDFKKQMSPVDITWRELMQAEGLKMREINPNYWVNALFADYKPLYKQTKQETLEFNLNSYRVTCKTCDKKFTSMNKRAFMCNSCVDNQKDKYPNWIITDLRFPNEAVSIKKRGGILIRVEREGLELMDDPSETSLDQWEEWDYKIDNNFSMEKLTGNIQLILNKENYG